MARLAEGLVGAHRTIRIDLIGHGSSDAPRDVAQYKMERCVAQIIAVLDALDVSHTHLLGYSMGGRIALQLAVHKPHLVRGLVLESASPGLQTVAERDTRRQSDGALAHRILELGMEAFVEQWLEQPLFAGLNALPEKSLATERAMRLRQRPLGLAHSLRGMGTGTMESIWDRIETVEAPLLLVTGEEDEKFTRIAGQMALTIPGSRLARIGQSGHLPHTEQPIAFLNAATRFILEHERANIRELA